MLAHDSRSRRRTVRAPACLALAVALAAVAPPTHAQVAAVQALPVQLNRDDVLHVLNRITFGPTSADLTALTGSTSLYLNYLNNQLTPNFANENPDIPVLLAPLSIPASQGQNAVLRDLKLARLVYAHSSNWQLNEVMAQFWEQMFNTNYNGIRNYLINVLGYAPAVATDIQGWLEWDDNVFYRTNAIGTFRDLLERTTLSPAMMIYLNQVNNKSCNNPNENYAREFLELYSMGPVQEADGSTNYNQVDIVEVAKCFTGWRLMDVPPLTAYFDTTPGLHCVGNKTIFAGLPHQTTILSGGGQELYDVVDYVAGLGRTADFVCRRLVRVFVADAAGDPGVEDALVTRMKNAWGTDGDIKAVLNVLLRSPEFLTKGRYRFCRARNPLEKVIWWGRAWDGTLNRLSDGQLDVAKLFWAWTRMERMGQRLFQYPAPDGFPYESEEQPGSSVSIETHVYMADVYRQLFVTGANPYALFPTINLPTIVQGALTPPDHEDPDKIATLFLERLYGSRKWTAVDHAAVKKALEEDVNGVPTPLDSTQLFLYAERLAIGATVAGSLNQASLK